MSADLLAEFGNGASTNQPSKSSRQQAVAAPRSLIPGLDALEDATPSHSFPDYSNQYTPQSAQLKTRHSQLHLGDFGDFGDFERPQSGGHNDVLFDATLEQFSDDDSDDWGEFESAEVTPGRTQAQEPLGRQNAANRPVTKVSQNPKSRSSALEALDLLESLGSLSVEDKPKPTYGLINHNLAIKSAKFQTKKPNLKRPNLSVQEEPFEVWGDFTDGPMQTIRSSSSNALDNQRASNKTLEVAQTPKAAAKPRETPQIPKRVAESPPASHVRPTNIPPPSILLELFPQLFERLRQEGTEAKRNVQDREALESVARSIICTLKAVARVVAGRTLRWKRDVILSQSMRIGPARSGKAGGMKLSTVNKNEDIKEKQEAVDVITMWRDSAALFNSVVQAAGKRPIQAILESTRVTTATASQGAIKASHACALCGLKRDERIPKIDEIVDDSFGEWWTEHWGHTESLVQLTLQASQRSILASGNREGQQQEQQEQEDRMGLSYNVYLTSAKIFGCKQCKTHLADYDDIISRVSITILLQSLA
ncbi:hypothetical protein BDV12DRAFT_192796 [Aspergillus spectabilis]